MGVPHDHLERPVPEQFCNRPQIYSSHYESTCKGVAVAMPGVPLDLRLFERAGKPPLTALYAQQGCVSPTLHSNAAVGLFRMRILCS
jgi:hypothetical protein